jgi:hypothetical protein
MAALADLLMKTPEQQRGVRAVNIPEESTCYVFLVLPRPQGASNGEYFETSGNLLLAFCLNATLDFPNIEDVIGIALDAGPRPDDSEQICYLNLRGWSAEQRNAGRVARDILKRGGYLEGYRLGYGTTSHFPTGPQKPSLFGNSMKGRDRNAP